MRGTKAAVQRAAYTFGMKHLQRWQERQNFWLVCIYIVMAMVVCLVFHERKTESTMGLKQHDGSPYFWTTNTQTKDLLRFSLFVFLWLLFFYLRNFFQSAFVFSSCMQLWSLWLVFGMGKLWETQSRVILLWRDMYQNKQQLHSVHRPGISLSRQNGQTQSVLISYSRNGTM